MRLRWFSPSSASVWSQCPGAVKLSQPYLDQRQKSESAAEGTAAHWVAEQMFSGIDVQEGSRAPNNVMISREMITHATEYLDLLPSHAVLEQKIGISKISDGMFGYVDAWYEIDDTLYIVDYKYGHRLVEAFENPQLLVSAAGLLQDYHKKVVLTVFQPRVYKSEPIDTWSLTVEQYTSEYLPSLIEAAREVKSDTPEVNTGSQCAICPARQACTALRESSFTAVDVTYGISSTDIPDEALGKELDILEAARKRLDARITGLQQQATLALEKGSVVPGYTIQPAMGRLKWDVPTSQVLALGSISGVDLRKPSEALTPTQAIKAGLDKAAVDGIASRPSQGSKLKKINFNETRKVFEK